MITLLKLSPFTGDVVAPSPNHDARKAPAIEGIVLHATEDRGDEALTVSWLRSPKSRVSCHLLVSRAGRVTRLVGDRERAWHAGLSWWRGTSDVNSITLGIEIANRNDGEPYTDAQYNRVAAIVAHYCGQGLSLDDVVSHEQIAEGRKTDPRDWDWERLRVDVRERLWLSAPLPAVVATLPAKAPNDSPPPTTIRAVPAALPKSATPTTGPVAVAVTPKPLLRSRTLWLNGLMVLASGGMLASHALDLAHTIGIHLPEYITKWALFIIGIVNIILRLRTTQPLSCSEGACSPKEVPPAGAAPPVAGDVAWPIGLQS
jgi:N-acetylmuramoyl-L-alanine amidase